MCKVVSNFTIAIGTICIKYLSQWEIRLMEHFIVSNVEVCDLHWKCVISIGDRDGSVSVGMYP